MLKFAANVSTLFTELPLRSRFAAARMAGFEAVECQFPYELTAGEVLGELEANRLELVLINAPCGDRDAGDRGLAALPGREIEFEASVTEALHYATATGAGLIHVLAGILPLTDDPDRALATYVDNLGRAAVEAERHGVTIVIEPINRRDVPGYFLGRTETARRVIEAVAKPNLGLLFDVYHRQMEQGDVTHALADNLDIIRHVQIANPPHRCAPDDGELNFDYIFQALRKSGYAGWIGCEYRPAGTSRDSFRWFDPWRPLRTRKPRHAAAG